MGEPNYITNTRHQLHIFTKCGISSLSTSLNWSYTRGHSPQPLREVMEGIMNVTPYLGSIW